VGSGKLRFVNFIEARLGVVRLGEARQGLNFAAQGTARLGMARLGEAGRGTAWQGKDT